ncbi:MAG: choice-of-anchor D domain-containing protein, partial [Bradymonadaceae bacterium]
TYSPEKRGARASGVITIENSDPRDSTNPLTVRVTALGNKPDLEVSPPSVRFAQLPPGREETQTVTLQNVGSAPLTIFEKPAIPGSENFSTEVAGDVSFPLVLDAPTEKKAANNSMQLTVTYAPTESGSDNAKLIIRSDEESGTTKDDPTVTKIDVGANADAPCILLNGTRHNLGSVPIGDTTTKALRIENCGTKPLKITGIQLTKNTDGEEFGLKLGDRDGDDDGELDDPVRLPNNGDRMNFAVEYTPSQEGTDRALIEVRSNDPVQPKTEVEIIGKGAKGECPEASVTAKVKGKSAVPRQNITAAPLDDVVLDASMSSDPDGRITDYQWRVIEKPDDVTVDLGPVGQTGDGARREFRPLTAGEYRIGVKVEDNDGFLSCNEAVAVVKAVPDEKVHVELTWTNPEDPDETDNRGSDIDVHMVKMGPGNWFQAPYDVYYKNPNNGGGGGDGIWNPENPSLDIDDRDGAGPENIQMDDPQQCQWYAVGVHYYQQLFGTAYVTIRIYINSRLVYEKLNKPLDRGGQFWDVARIHWPTGQVFDRDVVRPAPPVEQKPKVTDAMKNSGLCTAKDLY